MSVKRDKKNNDLSYFCLLQNKTNHCRHTKIAINKALVVKQACTSIF